MFKDNVKPYPYPKVNAAVYQMKSFSFIVSIRKE